MYLKFAKRHRRLGQTNEMDQQGQTKIYVIILSLDFTSNFIVGGTRPKLTTLKSYCINYNIFHEHTFAFSDGIYLL